VDTFPSKEKFGTQMSGGNGWAKKKKKKMAICRGKKRVFWLVMGG